MLNDLTSLTSPRLPWLVALLLTLPLASAALAQDAASDSLLNVGYTALQAGDSLQAVSAFRLAAEAAPTQPRPRLELGYLLANLDRRSEAVDELERAAALDSASAPHKDLGYLYIDLGRDREAASHFEQVAAGDATIALQLAYVYDRLGDVSDARRQFKYAAGLSDGEASAQARAELEARDGRPRVGTVLAEVYVAPLYQSRFSYVVATSVARVGYVLDRASALQVYGIARATLDTRSTGGLQPQIFADNAAVAGIGLRAQPLGQAGPTVYGEFGAALSLVDSEATDDGLDVRLGVYDFRQWGGDRPLGFVGEVYYDASYYSRYRNAIGYAQARPGVRLSRGTAGSVDAYAALAAVVDTEGLSFNNLVEGGPGVRWTLPRQTGLQLRAEYVRGRQFGTGGIPAVTYDDARLLVVYSRAFRLAP